MLDMQQPFKLGNITINPASDEISFEGNTIEIKSMAMKVICYFAAHPEQVISRDALREEVWQNSTASNHTINNHIYSLRQTLAKLDSQTKFFHTVTGSKSGYRLIVEVTSLNHVGDEKVTAELLPTEDSSNHQLNETNYNGLAKSVKQDGNKQAFYVKLLISSLVLITLLFVLSFFFNADINYHQTKVLTSQEGREQSPAISQDGEILLYANRTSRAASWELYAMKMHAPFTVKKVFEATNFQDNFVSISPNKRYIAFMRYTKGAKGIYIADFNADRLVASNAKLIIPLSEANLSPAISWLDDGQFYYSASEAVSAPLRIYLYDLALDRSEKITTPPIDSFGDFAAMVSPNKKWLAIMRAKRNTGFNLYLYNLTNKALIQTPVESHEDRLNISFSDDSERLYFINQKGYLSSYYHETKMIKTLSSEQYIGYWPLKIPNSNKFIMQQDWGLSSLTTQIIKINNPLKGGDGASEVIVNNDLSIRSIAGIADDGLVFASIKPNYQVELWKYTQSNVKKLTEFNEKPEYRYPLSLHWKKGSDLVLLSINNSCRIIQLSDGNDSPLCPDDKSFYAGRFSADGKSIYLADSEQENSSAVKMGDSGYPLESIPQLEQANLIHENTDGSFYYSKEASFDIYYANTKTGQHDRIIERTHVNNRYSVNDFVVVEDGIYFMDRKAVTKNAIYFYDFAEKNIIHVVNSKDNYPNIVLSEDQKSIYLIESVDNNTGLLLVE